MSSKVLVADSDASEGSEVEFITVHTHERNVEEKEDFPPRSVLSHRFRESPAKSPEPTEACKHTTKDQKIAVMVSPPARPWEYKSFEGHATVDSVLEEIAGPEGDQWYKIEYEDGTKEEVSYHT